MQPEFFYVRGNNNNDSTTCKGGSTTGYWSIICIAKMSDIVGVTFAGAWDSVTNEYEVQLGGTYSVMAGLGSAWNQPGLPYGEWGVQILINRSQTSPLSCSLPARGAVTMNLGRTVGCVLPLRKGDRVTLGMTLGCTDLRMPSILGAMLTPS